MLFPLPEEVAAVEIYYCDICGTRVSDADVAGGEALIVGSTFYCPRCVRISPDLRRIKEQTTSAQLEAGAKRPESRRKTRRTTGLTPVAKVPSVSPRARLIAVGAVLVVGAAVLGWQLDLFGGTSGRRAGRTSTFKPVYFAPSGDRTAGHRGGRRASQRQAAPARRIRGPADVPPETRTLSAARAISATMRTRTPAAGPEPETSAPGARPEPVAAPHVPERAEVQGQGAGDANRRGMEAARTGDVAGAEKAFREAIEADPDNARARNNLGAVLLEQEKWEEAEEHLLQALELEPEFAEARINLALLREWQWRSREAIAHLGRGLELAPQYAGHVLEVVKGIYQQHMETLDSDGPTDFAQATWLARERLWEKNWQAALTNLRKACKFDMESAEPYYLMGLVHEELGRPARAVGCYSRAIQLDADHYRAMNNLAWIHATSSDPLLKNPEVAVRYAERADRVCEGRNAAVLDTLARSLTAAGDRQAALRAARRAAELAPENEEIRAHLKELEAGQRP